MHIHRFPIDIPMDYNILFFVNLGSGSGTVIGYVKAYHWHQKYYEN